MSSSQSAYVTLISSDGFEFIVRRESAYVAGPIKRMLDPTSSFAEAVSGRCVFSNISGATLEIVCEYLYLSEKSKDERDVPDMEFPSELCLELLMAADFLQI